MSITFTTQERKDITRRQLSIPVENVNFNDAKTANEASKVILEGVEAGNKQFFDEANRIVESYQNELKFLNSQIRDVITEAQLVSSSKIEPGNLFFPTDGSHTKLYPKVVPSVNGAIVGAFSPYEDEVVQEVSDTIDDIKNGFTGTGTADVLNTAFDSAGFDVDVGGFVAAERVLIYDGSGVVDGVIDSVTPIVGSPPPAETIVMVTPLNFQSGVPGIGADIVGGFGGFTDSEREDLIATNPDLTPYLNSLTAPIDTAIANWKTTLQSEKTELQGNEELRAPEQAEIAAAIADIDNTIAIIDFWLALPSTGVGAKYGDAGLAPIEAEITARSAYVTSRIAEILAAFGTVDVSDPIGSSTPGVFFNRYELMDLRIGLIGGSLSRVQQKANAVIGLDDLLAKNAAAIGYYDGKFRTEKLAFDAVGTEFILIEDDTGFSAFDNILIISEDQPEIARQILSITPVVVGVTPYKQIELDNFVSIDYKTNQLARMVKEL